MATVRAAVEAILAGGRDGPVESEASDLAERFVLNREAMLASLVAGSNDFHYYHALDLLAVAQETGTLDDAFDAHLAGLKDPVTGDQSMAREIEARSQLIKYDIATAAGDEEAQRLVLDFLKTSLYVSHSHGIEGTREAATASGDGGDGDDAAPAETDPVAAAMAEPITVDDPLPEHAVTPADAGDHPHLFATHDLLEAEFERVTSTPGAHNYESITGFSDLAMEWLAEHDGLTDKMAISLLQRIASASAAPVAMANLVPLVVRHLNYRTASMIETDQHTSFGTAPIDYQLTLAQLDEVAEAVPRVRTTSAFVDTYISKLHPAEGVNVYSNTTARWELLERLFAFVDTLPASYNGHRGTLLVHMLEFKIQQNGEYDVEMFQRWLDIPRNARYVAETAYGGARDTNGNTRYHTYNRVTVSIFNPRDESQDQALITAFLKHIFVDAADMAPWDNYITDNVLKPLFASVKLTAHGATGAEADGWRKMINSDYQVEQLRTSVKLEFPANANKTHVSTADEVSLVLTTKNVPELVVKVFEINTEAIARTGGSVNDHMDLEGMEPNHQFRYTYDEAPIIEARREFTFPDLPSRGVFIFLFVGANRICRAVVRKGNLSYVQRMSVAGHILRVIDDTNAPVDDAAVVCNGTVYNADDRGEVCVPFTSGTSHVTANLTLRSGNFHVTSNLRIAPEDYALDAAIYVDREQLITGHRATVALRAALYLASAGNIRVPVSMVENVEMVVKTTDIEGTAASTSIKHFDLSDEQEYTYTFSCPDNVQTVDVTLTGTVPIAARTEAVSNLSASASFSLNAINKTDAMDDIYLRRTEGGYELMVLDKSGRPQAGRTFSVSAKNRYMSSSSTSVSVTADANGVAKLGHLEDVYEISALTKTFKLSADHVVYRPSVVVTADDEIAFPCLDEAVMASGLHVALVDSNGCGVVTTDHRDAVTIEGGYFRIGPLPVGSYTFSFAHNRSFAVIAIRVVDGADLTLSPDATGAVATFKLSQEPLDDAATAQQVVTGAPEPLHIVEASADGTAGTVSIQLGGFSPSTRVHVLFTHFDPIYDASRLSLGRRDPPLQTASVVRPASSFMSATTMSSEQVYILKRRYAAKQAGNMLDRPSLLLNLNDNPGDVSQIPDFSDPEAMAASSFPSASKKKMSKRGRRRMEKECEEECDDDCDEAYFGSSLAGAPFAASAPAPRRMGKKEMAGGFIEMSDTERNSILANNFRYNMGFLTKSALACYNIVPSDQGVIELELAADDLVDRYCVTVVAVDGFETSIKRLPLANARQSNRIYRDTRLLAALDAESHYSEEKRIDAAAAGATFAFPDVTASEYALYDDLARVYHLYHMLCQSAHVKTFAFVLKWGTLTEAEKRAKFSEYVSHELNFFIYKKDPEFFAAVVAPYLAHKKAKTFMDFWLLGDDEGVASYAQPRRFERLNIVEKILLGQRVDGDASLRLVNDLADLLPRDQEGFNALFKIALKAKLDASDQSALNAASNRAASALNPNLAGGGGGADTGGSSDFDRRAAYRQTYQDVAKTVEYGEMNYYKLKVEQCNDPGLVGINQFWRDYANHSLGGGDGAFVSSNFVRAHRTFTEVMFALAVLDLPAALDGDHTFHNADHPKLEITFACPTIVVHQQLSGAEWDAKPIIVTQNYFDPDDHFEYVDNERQDKYLDVGSTLLKTNKVYECEAVVSNITNTPQNLDLLLQIPRGAVPLRGGFYLKGWYARLDAYETATIKYFFYFPCPGRYVHFPVNALKNSVAIAAAEINTLTIVSELPRAYLRNSEEKSWVQIATNDDLETVLAYMESHNIQRLRMRSLAHRCRDKAWFDALVPYIRSRGHYSHALWSYGILHNDAQTIAEYLAHREGFLRSVGDVLATSLATIRPEADFRLQHLEYHPIVYSRAHYFDTSISSQAPQGLRTAYARLLKALTYVRQGTFDERLGLMYYLLSQERVGEAKAVLAGIAADPSINLDDGAPSCAMQFDYLLAYLDFYNTGTLEVAEAIAAKYADHPVARWRKLFREVANQIREARGEAVEDAEGDELSRNQAMSRLAAADPSLSLSVEDDSIVVNYENMEALDVNFFFTDVEVLFSRSPFRESVSSMEVKPNFTTAVELDPEASVFTMAVPDEVRGRNCIIEVSGAGRSDSVSYYSSSLNVQISEAYGQLKVTHADTGAPLRCVYVKVYAQEHGSSVFWKDCYTDLRGKADYATISQKNVSGVSKFSILVLSDEHGASIRACGPPRS